MTSRPPSEPVHASRPTAQLEVIIPAYNEASRLPSTLAQTVAFLEHHPWESQVVVVDNGSSDDTVGEVRAIADSGNGSVGVYLLGCSRPGKGAAVRRGLLSSRSQFVGFLDADLATPLETLTVAMRSLRHGATAVIASRHIPGARFVRPRPIARRLGGAAFRFLVRSAVAGIGDTQCGFKFFERNAVTRALVQCRTDGFAFDAELLRCVQREGGQIVEIPVVWTDGSDSTFQIVRDGVASFGAVLSLQGVRR